MAGNPFYDQVKALPDMYGAWNPMTYIQGQQQLGRANEWNENQMTQEKQATDLASMMNPLKVQQQRLSNQTTEAQFPGVQAQSSLAQDKATLSRNTLAQQLEQALAQQGSAVSKAHLEKLSNIGGRYSQAGQLMADIPGMLMTLDRARQILGDAYMPEFDKVNPGDLGQVLRYLGDNMSEASTKYQQQLGVLGAKSEAAQELARLKADEKRKEDEAKAVRARELESYKATLKEKVEKLKQSQDPKTYQAAAARLMMLANQEQDPERKAELVSQAQEFVNLQFSMAQAGAAAREAGKIDIGAETGMATKPPVQPPQLGGGNNPAAVDASTDKYKQAWPGQFDPNKYEYRIGPEGKPQRRLKKQ